MINPRVEAVRILTKFEKNATFSSISLTDEIRAKQFSDSRDTSLTVSLVYGVLEHKLTLDYNIREYLSNKKTKLKAEILNILRVGSYQILYMDKIPVSAAVNEAVKSSKLLGFSFAAGLVNAVLRKISLNGIVLPQDTDKTKFLSIKYSVNEDIVRVFVDNFGIDKTISVLEAFVGRRPIYIRRNSLKCFEEQLIQEFNIENVSVEKTKLDDCYAVEHTGDIAELETFKKGLFYVQDMSSQLCCRLLDAKPGETVVDCCAAPGGKSFTLSQYMKNSGTLYSCDLYEHKTELIRKSASRLGIDIINVICSDARNLNENGIVADRVLCDVPCSGFGVIGRKPEIRYKSYDEVSDLPNIQKEILYSCSKMVKPGGILVYSTCTLNKEENDMVCDSFLADNPDFSVDCSGEYGTLTERYLTILPDKESGDGFFIAKFIRGL